MESQEFRNRGREVVKYILDYHASIRKRRIFPTEQYGYLRELLPDSAPEKPEDFGKIFEDIEKCIMPGIIHWTNPRYFAYFPCGVSYPSILADMLICTIDCVGFSWSSGPACTELEILTLNWLATMIGLPKEYRSTSGGQGGGVCQLSASDALLVTVIAARHAKTKEVDRTNQSMDKRVHLPYLVAYCSEICYSSVINAIEVAMVRLHCLETDDKYRLRGVTLDQAIKEDQQKGLIPFLVIAILGTTACCSCDVVEEIGPICKKYGIWLHVDAAYAGSALICPELQYFLKGVEFAESFSLDPSMWMLMNFDCCVLWVKNRSKLTEPLSIDSLYLEHSFSDEVIDYRHLGIPLNRRFRSLKIWFVIRNYGVEGLQAYIREHIRLAKLFENFIRNDDRFVLKNEVHFALVCFRLKGCNALNIKLLSKINASGNIFLVGTLLKKKYVIRFCICSESTKEKDVTFAWETISKITHDLLKEEKLEHMCSEDDKECLEMISKYK